MNRPEQPPAEGWEIPHGTALDAVCSMHNHTATLGGQGLLYGKYSGGLLVMHIRAVPELTHRSWG